MLVVVPRNFTGSFERFLEARNQQVALRTKRTENLSRLQDYLRMRLAEFVGNTDPITGARLFDVGFEKQGQGMTLVVVLFEGSRLKIAVDQYGRFSHGAMPDVFETIAKIVDLRVAEDLSKAEFDYIAGKNTAGDGTMLTADFDDIVQALVVRGAETLEKALAEATLASREGPLFDKRSEPMLDLQTKKT